MTLYVFNQIKSDPYAGELPTIEPLNNRNKIIDHGENLELSVVCNDANIEYQWQYYFKDKDTTDLKNNPHYNQVDESTLIIRNAQKQHTGYYCCKVKNLAGYSTSEYFHVTVQGEHYHALKVV